MKSRIRLCYPVRAKGIKVNLEKIAYISLVLFTFTLPFYRKFSSLFLGVFVFSALLIFYKKRETAFKKLQATSLLKSPLILILYFSLNLLALFYTESANLPTGIKILEKNLAFLVFPILLTVYELSKKEVSSLLGSFVYGNILAALICIFLAILKSIKIVDNKILFKANIVEGPNINFFNSIFKGGNYFFSSNFSAFLHPTYFSMYLVLALAVVWVLKLKYKYLISLFLISILLLLSSKGAFISILFLFSIVLFIGIFSKKSKFSLGSSFALFALIACLTYVITLNPRVNALINSIKESKFEINPSSSENFQLRLMTYDAGIEIIKESFLLGVGPGDLNKEILKVYEQKNYTTPLARKLTIHNLFLADFAKFGILGLLVIGATFFFSVIKSLRQKNMLLLSLLVVVAVNGLFESVFALYSGVVFFAFFYCILYKLEDSKSQESNEVVREA